MRSVPCLIFASAALLCRAALAAGPATAPATQSVGHITFVEPDKLLLAKEVPALALAKVPLRVAFQRLSTLSGANIAVGWKALREAGADDAVPCTISLERGTLKQTLTGLLRQTLPVQQLVITAEDNVVFITTQAQADNTIETRTYYTADLLANTARWMPQGADLGKVGQQPAPTSPPSGGASSPQTPAATRPSGEASATQPAPPSAPSLFAPLPAPAAVPARFAKSAAKPLAISLEQLITSNIRPEIWKCNGGKIGEVHEVGERVVITAPQSVHDLLNGPSHHNPNQAPLYLIYSP